MVILEKKNEAKPFLSVTRGGAEWIDTGDGAIRWVKRANRPEPVRIQYLVPGGRADA